MAWTTYLQFFLALIFVLGLILGLGWALRRFGFGAVQGALARRRRVSIVESAPIDSRHRIVLLRRDDIEHLVLVGPNTSQVIERSIPAAALSDPSAGGPAPFSFRQLLSKEKQL